MFGRLSQWQQNEQCMYYFYWSVEQFTYITKWQPKINYQEHFPGLATELKMLLLLYNRYKARLISFTAELSFVQLNLIKHKLELWKADCLTISVSSCISGTVSSNLDWYWTFWKMKTPILCCRLCSTRSCTAAQRFTSPKNYFANPASGDFFIYFKSCNEDYDSKYKNKMCTQYPKYRCDL